MVKGLFIGGGYVEPSETYELFNPHTFKKVADVARGTKEEMLLAIESAHEGYQTLKEFPAYQRAQILYDIAHMIKERRDEIAETITLESAKPIAAAKAETDRAVQTFIFSAEEAKRLGGETIPLDASVGGEGRYAFTVREPIGVVGAITPFNFPLNLVVHKAGPAIASGNSIVIKPAEQTPLTSYLLAEIMTECGVPKGAVNVVSGDGPPLGEVLLQDDRVKKISFTGSPEVGKLIKGKAGLKKMTLELGSNAALYIDESMKNELDDIVHNTIIGAFSNSGQICVSTQRIYVHTDIYEQFIEKFVEKTNQLTVGDPLDEKTFVSSVISSKSRERIMKWIEEAKEGGAKILAGGTVEENLIKPTVISDTTSVMTISCNEIFGPVAVFQRVADSDEAVSQINDSRYGLNAGIFSNNLKDSLKMAKTLDVGQVFINDIPSIRFDHMPYGGRKDSGYGKEGVKYAIEQMTEMKMISVNYS